MKTVRRIVWLILCLLIAPIAVIGLIVTQPSWQQNRVSIASPDSAKLREHVRKLSEEFYPRTFSNTGNLARCADYIAGHFSKAGLTVEFQDYEVDSTRYRNVIGHVGTGSKDRIVVGAHYDACGLTHGADDNASGIAGLIELAYLLGSSHTTNNIELVAYCTEEPPYFATEDMGSVRHAKKLHDEGIHVRAAIVLEMIGYFSDEPGSQTFPVPVLRPFYPSRGNYIGVVGRLDQRRLVRRVKGLMRGATDLPVFSANAPSFIPGIDFSDHRSYWRYGSDAVMITDTAFYRNHQYHQTGDTVDRLDYARLAKVVAGVYEAVRGLR